MLPRERRDGRGSIVLQTTVLGVSALVILLVTIVGVRAFQSKVGQPGSVAQGLTAAGQVLGATSPRGPAADTLPGLATTATATVTPTATLTRTPTEPPTLTATPSATPTPDVSTYDPARAKTLLAEAQTSWGAESPQFVANVTTAAERLTGKQVAPGATFSFDAELGPFQAGNGYQPITSTQSISQTVTTVDGGITQVSTTLFQAVFWAGLKIDQRQTHSSWQDRFNAGATGQRGLDAYVADQRADLRFVNTTGDWIRIDAAAQPGSLTIDIYGADPGWAVNPNVSSPSHVVQPNQTPQVVADSQLPPGQQFTVAPGVAGFDVVVQRTVTKGGAVIDRYGQSEHYGAVAPVVAVGPTPTPSPAPTQAPTSTPAAASGPTHLAGLNPGAFVLPDGRIKVPTLTGLPEAEAQAVIQAVGLNTTFVNYQGPSDVPASALNAVAVGEVLSQTPPAGTAVARGTTVYIAVRKL
jgi:vancomycin resistance protein YoaR